MSATEIFPGSLPNQVFNPRFSFEIYRYDDLFFTEGLDHFFDTLELFATSLNDDRIFFHCLQGCYHPNDLLVHHFIENGSKVVDFTFAKDFEEFVIYGTNKQWGIYCHRAVEWVMFGIEHSIKHVYNEYFNNIHLRNLKYESIEFAVNNTALSLAHRKGSEFAKHLRRIYGAG